MRHLLALVPVLALVACAPSKPAETSLTSAEVTAPTAKNAAALTAAPESTTKQAAKPGELVCKASNEEQGTVELFLDWNNGTDARGLLRETAPSGMLYETTVHAAHYKNAIIADSVLSEDLVVHAAVVRSNGKKQQIRLGDWHQPWFDCQ